MGSFTLNSPVATLRALITVRHESFALELVGLFEGTVAKLEAEVRALRAENLRQARVIQEAQDKEAREKEAREKEAREEEAREKEAWEEEVRKKEAWEKEARKKEAREKEARKKEAREKEARKKEAREKEAREKEAREKEAREKEARERSRAEQERRDVRRHRAEEAKEEMVTEHSSDSDTGGRRVVQNQVREEELGPVEALTENSSDSEPEENPSNAVKVVKVVKVVNTVTRTDNTEPLTEHSSQSEGEDAQTPSQRPPVATPQFSCSFCGKRFSKKSILKLHEAFHQDSRPFECFECGQSFTKQHRLDRHMKFHKRRRPRHREDAAQKEEAVEEKREGGAPQDAHGRDAVEKLAAGWDAQAVSPSAVITATIDQLLVGNSAAKFEEEQTEAVAENNTAEQLDLTSCAENPECPVCGKTFSNTGNMTKHVRDIHGKKSFFQPNLKKSLEFRHTHLQCAQCNQRFRFRSALSRHMDEAHGTPPSMQPQSNPTKRFPCAICQKSFQFQSGLWRHKVNAHSAPPKAHSAPSPKPYQCPVCKKCFRDKHYLLDHVRIHNGEKPYQCASCSKVFTFRTSLKMHMKQHVGKNGSAY
ncbi:unnamed protein product [Knipowitschia caucasica]